METWLWITVLNLSLRPTFLVEAPAAAADDAVDDVDMDADDADDPDDARGGSLSAAPAPPSLPPAEPRRSPSILPPPPNRPANSDGFRVAVSGASACRSPSPAADMGESGRLVIAVRARSDPDIREPSVVTDSGDGFSGGTIVSDPCRLCRPDRASTLVGATTMSLLSSSSSSSETASPSPVSESLASAIVSGETLFCRAAATESKLWLPSVDAVAIKLRSSIESVPVDSCRQIRHRWTVARLHACVS